MLRIRIWQWPNILAVDAAIIAVFWQVAIAQSLGLQLSIAAQVVLGLSVWLTYMADRLFDVAKRPLQQLHSARHQFAKQRFRILWGFWWCILLSSIAIALAKLTTAQFKNGASLLTICLLYTVLNQTLSRRFFPKEICVAIIYAGGVVVFLLPNSTLWPSAGSLALLCLINCLIIGTKETQIDDALQITSMARIPWQIILLIEFACAASLYCLAPAQALPISLSLGALLILHANQQRLSVETFRVLTDAALLIGPSIALLIHL